MIEPIVCRTCARTSARVFLARPAIALVSRLATAVAIVTLIGLLPWLSGGDPALSLLRARSGEQEATEEALTAIRQHYGLDQGPLQLLWQWLIGLLHGDAGVSWVSGNPVLPGMLAAAGVSLLLMSCALFVALLVTMLLCAPTVIRGLRGDNRSGSGLIAIALTAMPEFLLAAFLLLAGAVWLHWFPPYGWRGWEYAVLPALALGLPAGGLLGKLFSDTLSSTFAEPWLITWSVAGFSRTACLLAVMRRALPAVLPQVGLVLVGLTGGAVAVEKVFAIPGLGRATLGASAAQDLPALQCGMLLLLLIATAAGGGMGLLRRTLLGRAIATASLPVPINSGPIRPGAYGIPALAGGLLALLLVAGLPRDPLSSDLMRLQAPSLMLPFGADATGRDLLARVAHGAIVTLATALVVTLGSLAIGLCIGLFPRLFTGPIEMTNALPPVISGMGVAALYGPSITGAAVAVMLVSWAPLAAHTAALVTEIHARPYVRIAPVLGMARRQCLLRYTLPGLLGPLVRHAMLRLPGIALALASLGFLGLGQQPPAPEWGRILAEGMPYVERAPWSVLAPVGALILLSVLMVSLSHLSRR
ncbi:ABC transporter permease subunit [Lonsdalea quercina]|uniref:ABC transporter permease subunit n=1 Tax=Lonsdalea quercina TaxID=71657 RepID=UPI0039764F58